MASILGPMPGTSMLCSILHTVAPGDSCASIIALQPGLTMAQFLKMNPNVGSDCTNLWKGYEVCLQEGKAPNFSATGTGIARCPAENQYTFKQGDNCYDVAHAHGMSLEALYVENNLLGITLDQKVCESAGVGFQVCVNLTPTNV